MKIEKLPLQEDDVYGDDHVSGSAQTPLRDDAFDLSDAEKIEVIQEKVGEILHTLGMDLTDDSLKGTPKRVAKMFVNEIFSGLHPNNKPKASTFDNKYKYGEMLVEKTSPSTLLANTIYCPSLGKPMSPMSPTERWLVSPK